MKVGLVMFYDDVVREYGDLTREINQIYCDKYDLDLIFSSDRRTTRHPAWERIPLILDNLRNYDYLVWIDADAFFYLYKNIKDMVCKNKDFVFSMDIGHRNVNTGIFIVKNSEYSHEFLRRWMDEDLYASNPYPQWWDQGVLIDMINRNVMDIRDHVKYHNYGTLQHFYKHEFSTLKIKPFVMHLASWPKKDRVLTARMYLDALKTNLVSSKPTVI